MNEVQSCDGVTYAFDGIYEPADAARYLAATLPWRERPLTTGRVLRWIRAGLVAGERRNDPGHQLTINFEDLVTCQVITLLREAGFSIRRIRAAESFCAEFFDVEKPFAYAKFWHVFPDILTNVDGQLISISRRGQFAFDFLAAQAQPMLSHLEFRDDISRPCVWRPHEGVSLKPAVQFGQPCLDGTRIPTSAIWGYVNAGDRPEYVAKSYGIGVAEVEQAIRWERRLRADLKVAAAA